MVLRRLPPLRFDLPALDGVTSAMASVFGPLGSALGWARDWVLDFSDVLRDRIDTVRQFATAWDRVSSVWRSSARPASRSGLLL